jgi:hypothetical protein
MNTLRDTFESYNQRIFPLQVLMAVVATLLVGLLFLSPGATTTLLLKAFLSVTFGWIGVACLFLMGDMRKRWPFVSFLTMDPFTQAVEGWHDFYLLVGTAAATLVGLLFVSLSLNVDVITRKANADLRALAAQTFAGFLNVVMLAVLFLIPRQVPLGLGLPLLGISGYGLYETVGRLLKTRRARSHGWGWGGIARRFVFPALCFVALTIIAVSVLLGQTGGLYWLVPVMILLIVAASRNAWDLLLRLREPTATPTPPAHQNEHHQDLREDKR